MKSVRKNRDLVFLKDVLLLSFSSFGGPQTHLGHFHKNLVERRRYISETELQELNALCQVLPGPTSTQTICAIGYRLGGPRLAYLTLLIWALPSVCLMIAAGMLISSYQSREISLAFTRFIQPMAVGFVAYAGYTIIQKNIQTKSSIAIMIGAAVVSFLFRTPYIFPATILVAGALTSFKYKNQPEQKKLESRISWNNLMLWAGVLVFAAAIGGITKSLPIRLFENFYRNGSLIFGGGQVLTPLLYTEFVEYAKPVAGEIARPYVTSEEFLSGFALAQSLPGPIFSFSAYLGALAMHSRGLGPTDQVIGGLFSAAGIFLPGIFLIFFMIRVWEALKKYRPIRASLEGILAANAGLVTSAAVMLFQPLEFNATNVGLAVGTFLILVMTKIPSWVLIPIGLLSGLVFR